MNNHAEVDPQQENFGGNQAMLEDSAPGISADQSSIGEVVSSDQPRESGVAPPRDVTSVSVGSDTVPSASHTHEKLGAQLEILLDSFTDEAKVPVSLLHLFRRRQNKN